MPVLLTLDALLGAGVNGWTLTGSAALALHDGARALDAAACQFGDIDFVVEIFDQIPSGVADRFLVNHIHPHAPEGKLLIQLIDPVHAVRIDVFRAFGRTMSRARLLADYAGALKLIAIEDLVARTTSHVYGRLRSGRPIESKYVGAFRRLMSRGDARLLEEAWADHHQMNPGTLAEAIEETRRLLDLRTDLVRDERISNAVRDCDRCEAVASAGRVRSERSNTEQPNNGAERRS